MVLRLIVAAAFAGSVIGAASGVSLADTLESVEKDITKKLAKHKSVWFKMKSTTDYSAGTVKMKSTTDMTFEMINKGKSWLSRMEGATDSTTETEGQKPRKDKSKSLMIYDGEFQYSLSESADYKSATKMKPDPKMNYSPFDGAAMFKQWRAAATVKFVGEENVGGKKIYLIEMTAKGDQQSGSGKTVMHFDKDSGIANKTVVYDGAGKVMTTSVVSGVKLDADISADRFKFKLPKGVQLTDMTQNQAPTGGGSQAQTESKAEPEETKAEKSEVKEEEEKEEEEKKESKTDKLKSLFK
jgi:outer membrane lipoprotein-sorting protein